MIFYFSTTIISNKNKPVNTAWGEDGQKKVSVNSDATFLPRFHLAS